MITMLVVLAAVLTVVTVIVTAIALIEQSSATALIYIDLRMRKEGLDLELERHVELRDAGHPVDDPYRAPDRAAAAAGTPSAGSERPATWS